MLPIFRCTASEGQPVANTMDRLSGRAAETGLVLAVRHTRRWVVVIRVVAIIAWVLVVAVIITTIHRTVGACWRGRPSGQGGQWLWPINPFLHAHFHRRLLIA